MIPLLLLAAGTLASEDLTCIGAGLLVRRGQLHWSAAIAGCFLGIYVGDLGLWLMGRLLGRQVMRFEWLSKRLPQARLAGLGAWFDRHTATSVFAARFVPGTRLPIYAAAGALGKKGVWFALWTLIAALIWTPILVLLAASIGDAFATPFMRFLGAGWLYLLVAVFAMVCLIRIVMLLVSEIGRAKLMAKLSRIWRWEFWPMWLFYLPLIPWIAWLCVRWRGLMTITAANPGIPLGGFVGESKFQILFRLKGKHVSPTALINPGDP
jgi:membrane protein DedA with SNARE-associated domain